MKSIKKINRNTYIYFAIIIVFVSLSFFVSMHHEPWADEANPWLIARDASIPDLFKVYLHSEGHPSLWYLILKFFQFCGLKYTNFYLIPILFSTIGLVIFLFKSNFKLYLKILFPFTYFIFYQYTIVARGYCLILPLLSLIAWIYPKRYDKPYLFSILLILLLNLEAYTYILSGCIFILYLYDYIKLVKKKEKPKKSYLISLIILSFSFIITAIYTFPSGNYSIDHRGSGYFLSDSLITSFHYPGIIKYFATLLIIPIIYITYEKYGSKRKIIELAIFTLPIIGFFIFKYYNLWHLGIIFEVFIFLLWIHEFNDIKVFNYLLLITFAIQLSWSVASINYDLKNNYSSGKTVANFIKKYNYKEMNIYALSYYEVSINPYFNQNIFKNWDQEYSFFYINYNNKFYRKRIDEAFINKYRPDMVISSSIANNLNNNKFKSKYYNKYYFKGYTYVENKKYENQEIVVYVLKNKDIIR